MALPGQTGNHLLRYCLSETRDTKKAQVQTKEIVYDGLDVSSLAEAVTQEVIARLPGQNHE